MVRSVSDGASVTLISNQSSFEIKKPEFHTFSKEFDVLMTKHGGYISMKGFNLLRYIMSTVPSLIKRCLEKNKLKLCDIDLILMHQGSKAVVDRLISKACLNKKIVPFDIQDYGNTASSTIPILLEKYMHSRANFILLVGFGVGLSSAVTLLKKSQGEK